jgi:hypothetical protein
MCFKHDLHDCFGADPESACRRVYRITVEPTKNAKLRGTQVHFRSVVRARMRITCITRVHMQHGAVYHSRTLGLLGSAYSYK